jgi:SAM-dependent methyltransferase
VPRKLVHLDAGAIAALSAIYAELLPTAGRCLDLMSSWRSHLPQPWVEKPDVSVTGLGMNAEEMLDNPQLTGHVLHDLNENPRLPFDDGAFAAAMCAVSIQYLVRPVEVLTDVARVLTPGAALVVSFSNRCFPTKAIAGWLLSSDDQHLFLVAEYFRRSGQWSVAQIRRHEPPWGDPLFVVWATRL